MMILPVPPPSFLGRSVSPSFLGRSDSSWSVITTARMASAREASSPVVSSAEVMMTPRSNSSSSSSSDNIDQPVILFDGVCNFCNKWVDLLLRLDVNQRYKFAPLQSATGGRLLEAVGKDATDLSSVILIVPPSNHPGTQMRFYAKSACVLQVVRELGPVARVVASSAEGLLPLRVRDSIYDMVAENRYQFLGKRTECRCGDPKYADRFL